MTELSTGQETPAVVNFCPECGSPSINDGDGAGAVFMENTDKWPCSCAACEWVGTVGELLSVPFSHELGGKENIVKELLGDLRVTLAKFCATPIGVYLMKWGFLGKESYQGQVVLNRKQLARYMTAISHAVLMAVIEERKKMEKERVSGN